MDKYEITVFLTYYMGVWFVAFSSGLSRSLLVSEFVSYSQSFVVGAISGWVSFAAVALCQIGPGELMNIQDLILRIAFGWGLAAAIGLTGPIANDLLAKTLLGKFMPQQTIALEPPKKKKENS